MQLTAKLKVLEIKKKTRAEFFKDVQVGDEIELMYSLSGHYGSSPYIHIKQGGKVVHRNNALQLSTNLENFKVEQL